MTFVTLLLSHALLLSGLGAPPFGVGETLRYDAKLGYFAVGSASLSLSRTAQERGTAAYVFTMAGQGGPPGWRVRYDLTSWVDSQRASIPCAFTAGWCRAAKWTTTNI